MRKHSHFFDILRCAIFVLLLVAFASFCITVAEGQTTTAPTEQNIPSPEPAPEPEISPESLASFPEAREITPTANQTPVETEDSKEVPQRDPFPLTDDERLCIEAVVAAETAGEDFEGQCLVAMCIRNSAEATGKSPAAIALEPGQYASPNYSRADQVSEAVSAVFDDGYQVTEEPIRYFYAPALCESEWHEQTLEYVLTHGGHRFFKEA